VARHNSVKHINFTEEVNNNDMGASSGITLLDEFRRYTLTGKASEHSRLKSRVGDSISNINDANIHWVCEEFEQDCQTKTHVLPPNIEAHEMQSINLDDYTRIQDQVYDRQVHLFFNLPHAIANTSSRDRSKQEEHTLSEEQYTSIRRICNFLQTVAENTYSVTSYMTPHTSRLHSRQDPALPYTAVMMSRNCSSVVCLPHATPSDCGSCSFRIEVLSHVLT